MTIPVINRRHRRLTIAQPARHRPRQWSSPLSLLVFDSGIGGLGVVAALRRLAPDLDLAYLADNAGFPYGERSDAYLLQRILALLAAAIAGLRPSAVVMACNTASTIALAGLRAAHDLPIIGCVPPIKPAAAASRSFHVGLLATPATIRRPYLRALIAEFAGGRTIHALGTPLLADLAEQKFAGATVDLAGLAAATAPLFARPGGTAIDAIALGCTHYTFLLPELGRVYPGIGFFDPAEPVARQTLKVAAAASPRRQTAATAWFTGALPRAPALDRFAAYGFSEIAAFPPPPPDVRAGKAC